MSVGDLGGAHSMGSSKNQSFFLIENNSTCIEKGKEKEKASTELVLRCRYREKWTRLITAKKQKSLCFTA